MWFSKEALCYRSSVREWRHCLHEALDILQYVEGLPCFLLLLILLIKSMVGGLKCESTWFTSHEDSSHIVVDVNDDLALVSTT